MSTHRNEYANLVNHAGGFFAGLLMGGLIGSGTMLLLAPRSGEKTRAKLQHEGLELRDQVTENVKDAVTQARDKARQVASRVHKQVQELDQRGQEMLDEQKEVVADVVKAEKTAIHNATKELS